MAKLVLIKTQADFEAFRQSKSFQTSLLRMRVRTSVSQNTPRFGFIVPKKVLARAVDRNLMKRRVKNVLLKSVSRLKPVDVLFFPSKQLLQRKFSELEAELESLFTKANLWR